MLPLKDDNPTGRIPVVTIGLIAINCLIYLYQATLSVQAEQLFVFRFGLLPVEVTNLRDMTPEVPFPVWLSPLTSMFLHGDLLHLAGNMLYLWIFGNNVEDFLGRWKFLGFYLMSGLAADFLFVAFNSQGTVPLVGASGAIAGVLGAYMVVWPRARILTLIWIVFFIRLIWLPAVIILGYWIILQLVMAMSSVGSQEGGGVAWFAHIGGFIFGWVVTRWRKKHILAMKNMSADEQDYYNRWH